MDTDPMRQAMREYFRALGAKGGKKGGKKRWAGTTAEERSAAMKEVAAQKQQKKAGAPKSATSWRDEE